MAENRGEECPLAQPARTARTLTAYVVGLYVGDPPTALLRLENGRLARVSAPAAIGPQLDTGVQVVLYLDVADLVLGWSIPEADVGVIESPEGQPLLEED